MRCRARRWIETLIWCVNQINNTSVFGGAVEFGRGRGRAACGNENDLAQHRCIVFLVGVCLYKARICINYALFHWQLVRAIYKCGGFFGPIYAPAKNTSADSRTRPGCGNGCIFVARFEKSGKSPRPCRKGCSASTGWLFCESFLNRHCVCFHFRHARTVASFKLVFGLFACTTS